MEVSGATYLRTRRSTTVNNMITIVIYIYFFSPFHLSFSLFPSAHFSFSLESCFVHIHDRKFNSFGENMINYQFVRKKQMDWFVCKNTRFYSMPEKLPTTAQFFEGQLALNGGLN